MEQRLRLLLTMLPNELGTLDITNTPSEHNIMYLMENWLRSGYYLSDKEIPDDESLVSPTVLDIMAYLLLWIIINENGLLSETISNMFPLITNWSHRIEKLEDINYLGISIPLLPQVKDEVLNRRPKLVDILDTIERTVDLPIVRAITPIQVDWNTLPPELDPQFAQVSQSKSIRKKAQIDNLAALFGEIIMNNDHIKTVVEFGSGGGHLGLVLACLYPQINFVLLEQAQEANKMCQTRILRLGIENVKCYELNAQEYEGDYDLALGLHCCGSFTDMILSMCKSKRKSFLITPCCYGHSQPEISNTSPRSTELFQQHKKLIFPAADFSSMSHRDANDDIYYDMVHPKYQLALRCMKIINYYRGLSLSSTHHISHHILTPINITPKNLCIVGLINDIIT
eukprot:NODE_3681_length_1306_cov_30.218090_g3218_i0.p1 GENE.NODE_3681_length_1306_cov_30.218090_g3218_i0~~NODE_3681_length_1306_cov_30.218090_g3218_i0.p1  ORF type:complete len:423 (-),score=78.71 NODE_3681_length_1306_cov_30.218090_g3218_i0:37-1230(-)